MDDLPLGIHTPTVSTAQYPIACLVAQGICQKMRQLSALGTYWVSFSHVEGCSETFYHSLRETHAPVIGHSVSGVRVIKKWQTIITAIIDFRVQVLVKHPLSLCSVKIQFWFLIWLTLHEYYCTIYHLFLKYQQSIKMDTGLYPSMLEPLAGPVLSALGVRTLIWYSSLSEPMPGLQFPTLQVHRALGTQGTVHSFQSLEK